MLGRENSMCNGVRDRERKKVVCWKTEIKLKRKSGKGKNKKC